MACLPDDDFFKIAVDDLTILPLLLFEGVALSTDLCDARLDAGLLELQPIADRRLCQVSNAATKIVIKMSVLNPLLRVRLESTGV